MTFVKKKIYTKRGISRFFHVYIPSKFGKNKSPTYIMILKNLNTIGKLISQSENLYHNMTCWIGLGFACFTWIQNKIRVSLVELRARHKTYKIKFSAE
jgi:hypothetical protein